jgi:signal transduction histidine kinase
MRSELRHLTALLDDLFELSRIESGALALHCEHQIYRALTNLLQNAVRYTPAGGTILIHAGPAPASESGGESPGVQVQVIDTGEGVSAADLPHIFERTYRGETSRRRIHSVPWTAQSTGAGLGLAITRGIIEAHGQRIWAESPLTQPTLDLLPPDRSGARQERPGTALKFTLSVAAPMVDLRQ